MSIGEISEVRTSSCQNCINLQNSLDLIINELQKLINEYKKLAKEKRDGKLN